VTDRDDLPQLDLEVDLELDLELDLDVDSDESESGESESGEPDSGRVGVDDPVADDSGADDSGADDADGLIETDLGDGQLAYDCAAWAGESRSLLASLLTTSGIAHAWQGTMLTVREQDEAAVDDLVDEVLAAARPALDPTAVRLVYEVGSWPVALQTELAESLTVADIVYEWDERGDLVVAEADEDAVAAVLDELPEPDGAADPDAQEISADDGVAVHELFDSLFMAASRLVKHPADPAATVSMVDDADLIARVAVPFGFETDQWRGLVAEVDALRVALEAHPADDESGRPEDGSGVAASTISELAKVLGTHLRQYI